MKTMKMKLVLATIVVATFLLALPAFADTVTIGLQEAGYNGGAIQTEASGTDAASITALNYGTFTISSVQATAGLDVVAPQIFDSSSLNTSTNTAGTLSVYITDQNVQTPIGSLVSFLSSFTANAISSGLTVTMQTFIDRGDGLFTVGTPLSSAHTLTSLTTQSDITSLTNLSAGYSLTERYIISAANAGTVNNTIDIQSAPEPSSLLLVGFGLLCFGFVVRRRQFIAQD